MKKIIKMCSLFIALIFISIAFVGIADAEGRNEIYFVIDRDTVQLNGETTITLTTINPTDESVDISLDIVNVKAGWSINIEENELSILANDYHTQNMTVISPNVEESIDFDILIIERGILQDTETIVITSVSPSNTYYTEFVVTRMITAPTSDDALGGDYEYGGDDGTLALLPGTAVPQTTWSNYWSVSASLPDVDSGLSPVIHWGATLGLGDLGLSGIGTIRAAAQTLDGGNLYNRVVKTVSLFPTDDFTIDISPNAGIEDGHVIGVRAVLKTTSSPLYDTSGNLVGTPSDIAAITQKVTYIKSGNPGLGINLLPTDSSWGTPSSAHWIGTQPQEINTPTSYYFKVANTGIADFDYGIRIGGIVGQTFTGRWTLELFDETGTSVWTSGEMDFDGFTPGSNAADFQSGTDLEMQSNIINLPNGGVGDNWELQATSSSPGAISMRVTAFVTLRDYDSADVGTQSEEETTPFNWVLLILIVVIAVIGVLALRRKKPDYDMKEVYP